MHCWRWQGLRAQGQGTFLSFWTVVVFALAICPLSSLAVQDIPHVASGKSGMIASVHPLASQAGLRALESGGNAIDAAIATALTLGVVDGYNSGIGGGCFVLIRTPDGSFHAIDAREMAPSAAHRDMYLRNGKPDTMLSQIGPLAIAVPGALAGYSEAVEKFGQKPFRELILPAATIADEGFVVSKGYASLIKSESEYFAKFDGSMDVFFDENQQPIAAGQRLVQKDLANTYRAIAKEGTDWFYRGAFAEQTGKWMLANGGIITAQDFAAYHTVNRKTVETTYRGYSIIGFPPPSSGGVHVAQILNIVENFDLEALDRESPVKCTHVVTEAMKLAFADRAFWLGDPDFASVPKGLIDKSYAKQLAEQIDLSASIEVLSHGTPPLAESDLFEKHTTHIAAADDQGNWVAITTTVNTTFGSKVIVPGLGVVMNNQMDDFAIAPGVPNAFGLVGNEANSVGPGKRPLSSMSPTLVTKDGVPVMSVGAAGGPKIITSSLLAIIRTLDLGFSPENAIAAPRFHHQWSPNKLYVERSFPAEQIDALKALGHRVETSSSGGVSQAIFFDAETKTFLGVADPRAGGQALGR